MSALGKKLRRDLWQLKGQVATIALVLACGIMAILMLRSSYASLLAARDSYYASYRFADVFVRLERAPRAALARLEDIPGVAVVSTRIVEEVMVPLPDEPDPVTGRIVSLPDIEEPRLNALYLRAGRLPVVGADDEAVILEQFATAHGLIAGDRVPVVLNGRLREMRIVGIALSPEYVLAMAGGELVPDDRRFVVLWMREAAIAPAFQMEGAFNDVSLRLEPGASLDAVLSAVDAELARYGGMHAIPRDKQLSNWSLTSELDMLRTLAFVIPAIFLAVSAFLVNVVVSRLVALERTQIAVLKALGLTERRIALHYLALVSLIVVIAAIVGVAAGVWTAGWMTDLYTEFYRFPTRLLHVSPSLIAGTIGVGLAAGVVGALGAVRVIARMPPAQAMRPPAPLTYRRSVLERLHLGRVIGPSAMMIVREIERRPLRFALSTLGIAMGLGIFLMGRFSWDSFDRLMSETFLREHREDLVVTFPETLPARAVQELEHLPGVELGEGHRIVPVRLRAGTRWRDLAITGLPQPSVLRQLLDRGETPREVPPSGLILTNKLAEILDVQIGDEVDAELLEGDWSTRRLPVAGVIDEAFGLQAYARADWLGAVLGEEPRVSMVLLRIDPAAMAEVRAELKDRPEVLGVTTTLQSIARHREQTGGSMLGFTIVLTVAAAAIAVGVVYNNARIALAMRSRDLASLRVLGFTRREISSILLGELGAQVLLGIPLGLVLGTWWAELLARTIDPEAIRLPMYIAPRTYATAAVIALVSGLASALLVRRKLDHLDLIGVLKSSE